jgi:uncharacterized alpha/beta hydrolase family protein
MIIINDDLNQKILTTYCREDYLSNSSTTKINNVDIFVNIDFESIEKHKKTLPTKPEISSETELKENNPVCCTNNECLPCCTKEECFENKKNYPVVFIHGHAFNDANNPDFSMNSFSNMQRKLSDDGFISFGELDLESDLKGEKGKWGIINKPITLRASYYYITHYDVATYRVNVQKSESIENYALRLKEIIDLVKQKTGSSKVNIVAHSMGGLVTRQYLQLFNYDSVDKIILINTPNNGVSGRVNSLCSIFGASKECTELAEGSIFLNRLNSKSLPENNNVFAIRSTGCAMDDKKDGDGIVNSDSAYLEGAKNYEIKGICKNSFGTDLHTDSLNPEEYPEMYNLIKNILSE